MKRPDPRAVLVGTLCGYEIFALVTGRVPTITRLCWKLRATWPGRGLVWVAGGVLMYHLLVEEDVLKPMADAIEEAMP